MSVGTQDTNCYFTVSFKRLSLALVDLPMSFNYSSDCVMFVLTPRLFLTSGWPRPRSLATTSGISVDVFSSPYLDVSVQAVPLL